ncbi:MAG: DUF4199 domain-containing protein [Bacteroidetes bacterium]|nr:MAG: DUF4199 domain-containing protein [Bacteroidota bacterium]
MNLNYSFRCALLSTGIYIAIKLAAFFTHTQFTGVGAYSGLITLGLTGFPLYAGIRHKRDQKFGGFINIRQVMVAGVKISISACLLIALYTYIHYSYIDREVIVHWIAEAKRLGAQENKSEAEIQEAIKMLTEFYSPFKQATVALVGILGTGTVLSFMLSSFLVRKPKISEN